MFAKFVVGLVVAVSLTSAASAGLNDGIRPGPSAPQWLLPAQPRAPYALTGSSRTNTPRRGAQSTWTRETRQFGNKVTVDSYVR